jgi:hypothetical protein
VHHVLDVLDLGRIFGEVCESVANGLGAETSEAAGSILGAARGVNNVATGEVVVVENVLACSEVLEYVVPAKL